MLLIAAGWFAWNGARPWFRGVRRDEPLIPIRLGDQIGLITADGFLVGKCRADAIEPFDDHGMARVMRGDRFGWIERSLQEVIPTVYRRAPPPLMPLSIGCPSVEEPAPHALRFGAHQLTPAMRDGKVGFLDRGGREAIPFEWDGVTQFNHFGLALVQKDGKVGWIHHGGRSVIPVRWDQSLGFTKAGVAVMRVGSDTALLDIEGRAVLEPQSEPVVLAGDGRLIGIGDPDRAVWHRLTEGRLVRLDFSLVESRLDDEAELLRALRHGRFGWVTRSGDVALPFEWDEASDFVGRHAIVRRNGRFGVIDRQGRITVPVEHEEIRFCDDDPDPWCIRFRRHGRWGLLGTRGEVLVVPEWDGIGSIDRHGMTPVQRNRLWGWVDRRGELVIPPTWRKVGSFNPFGAAEVEGSPGCWVIDRRGSVIFTPDPEGICSLWTGGYVVCREGSGDQELFGLLDGTGRRLTATDFEDMSFREAAERIVVTKRGRKGVINFAGREVLPCRFDEIEWSPARPSEVNARGAAEGAFVAWNDDRCQRYSVEGRCLDPTPLSMVFRLDENPGVWGFERADFELSPEWKSRLGWIGLANHSLFRGTIEIRTADHRLVWSARMEALRSVSLPLAGLLTLLAAWLARPWRWWRRSSD